MKKIIEIPDTLIETLKIEAIKASKSFKKYLEDIIIKEAKK